MMGIHRWPVNSPHKGPVTRKMFPFEDVIMQIRQTEDIVGYAKDTFRYVCMIYQSALQWRHMGVMATQITGHSTVCSGPTIWSVWHQRKYQSSALLILCEGDQPVAGYFSSQKASNAANVSTFRLLSTNVKFAIWGQRMWGLAFCRTEMPSLAWHRSDRWLSERPQHFHDDVIKWKRFPRCWPFVGGIHRSPVNSPHKVQWHGALMFSLICAWMNGWVNTRDAGD